jgi:hypothetical protein
MMCADVADRAHPLSSYGLAFPRPWARRVGVNPVWYIDILRTGHGGEDWLTVPLMNLVKQTLRVGGETYARPFDLDDGAQPEAAGLALHESPIARPAPFIETMGPLGDPPRRREFWWEREWRHRGDLRFDTRNVVAASGPTTGMRRLRANLSATEWQYGVARSGVGLGADVCGARPGGRRVRGAAPMVLTAPVSALLASGPQTRMAARER